jgi:hypothetical protein
MRWPAFAGAGSGRCGRSLAVSNPFKQTEVGALALRRVLAQVLAVSANARLNVISVVPCANRYASLAKFVNLLAGDAEPTREHRGLDG